MAADRQGLPTAAWVAAALALAVHLLPQPGYGFHRDELLYLAMGEHLEPFRMGFPPMIAALAQLARALPLELLTAIRLLPALAVAGLVLVAAATCRALGGSRGAQGWTALTVAVAPLFLRAATLFQPVVFEQLWWSLAVLALARLLAGGDRRWWLGVGAAVGAGALTKFSVAFLGAGIAAAVLLTPLRAELRTRWPWLALALAAGLAAPSVAGQVTRGWPFLAQMRALQAHQLDQMDRRDFVTGQFLMLGPGAPLWLAGLVALLLARALRPFRALGILALTVIMLLLLGGGKAYYFGPLHPLLLAAAATVLVPWLERPGHRWAYAGAVGFLLLGGVLLLPLGVPLLPPERMAGYAAALGQGRTTQTNYGTTLALPQDFADMTGWPEQVAAVAAVFHALPAEEQSRAMILANNYGRAGALALFGPAQGLPYPVSRHGDFYFWGTGARDGAVTIIVGGTPEQWREYWDEVTLAARATNRWGVDEEQDVPIFVCRRPRVDLPALFRQLGPYWG